MRQRDRASGWKHAKLSGHSNEEAIKKELLEKIDEQELFLSRVGKANTKIKSINVGGLNESNVGSIYPGNKTKSKTDLHLKLCDDSFLNFSIKKSLSGQVYLIRDDRFMHGFETQYHKTIPADVKRAITLFWGSAEDTLKISDYYGADKTKAYERRKHRLVANTILNYDKELYTVLINWFSENAFEITDYCFSRGLAKNSEDWASWIWYKNLIGEQDVDTIFSIESICDRIKDVATKETYYGVKGGGTTIQLPFGFVQWHQGQMQFHHNFEKINSLIKFT